MEDNLKRRLLLFGLLMTLAIPSGLFAQQSGYFQTNLVSNTAGIANTTDTQLLNPWGISILPGQDFWIANNNSGTSTLYDENGNKDTALVVTYQEPQRILTGIAVPAALRETCQMEAAPPSAADSSFLTVKMAWSPSGPAPATQQQWPSITPPAARFTKVSPCSTTPSFWQRTSIAGKSMSSIASSSSLR
jgi:hypothetical protein